MADFSSPPKDSEHRGDATAHAGHLAAASHGTHPNMRVGRAVVSVNAAGQATPTVNFAPPFADANYTAVVLIEQSTNANTLHLDKILSRTADGITVRVTNADAINLISGTLHVVAIHD